MRSNERGLAPPYLTAIEGRGARCLFRLVLRGPGPPGKAPPFRPTPLHPRRSPRPSAHHQGDDPRHIFWQV